MRSLEMRPSSDCCKVIVRSRHAHTPWEKLCKLVVGDPVHMDIVLAKPQSSSARFVLYPSSYSDMITKFVLSKDVCRNFSHQMSCIIL